MGRVKESVVEQVRVLTAGLPLETVERCLLDNHTLSLVVDEMVVRARAPKRTVCRELAAAANMLINDGKIRGAGKPAHTCRPSVYAAKTAIYPGMVKIGCTTTGVAQRMASLSSVGLHKYEVISCYTFPFGTNIKEIEKDIHDRLGKYRVRPDREWFFEECLAYMKLCFVFIENAKRSL